MTLEERFAAARDAFAAHPTQVLDPKTRELVLLAVDAAATHLYTPGIAAHLEAARELGASSEELAEVLQIVSVIGIHGVAMAAPIVVEAFADDGPLDERRLAIKADFEERRRTWGPAWEAMLRLDPGFVAAYADFSSGPWEHGVLEPKVKEFIYIAIDASATHMFEPGVRQHVQAARGFGATKEEIMEVLELTALVGLASCAEAFA